MLEGNVGVVVVGEARHFPVSLSEAVVSIHPGCLRAYVAWHSAQEKGGTK